MYEGFQEKSRKPTSDILTKPASNHLCSNSTMLNALMLPSAAMPVRTREEMCSPVIQLAIGDQNIGTDIRNNTTGNIYKISKTETSADDASLFLYVLERGILIKETLPAIRSDDQNYDVFSGSTLHNVSITEAHAQASHDLISEKITRDFTIDTRQTQKSPAAQAEFSKKQKIYVTKCLELAEQITYNAIALEKNNPQYQSFYNATGLKTYILHQMIKAIKVGMHEFSPPDFEFFRTPDSVPSPDVYRSGGEYALSRPANWNDHSAKDDLLSVNIPLLGSFQSSGESSIHMLLSNGLAPMDTSTVIKILQTYLQNLGFTPDNVIAINMKIHALLDSCDEFIQQDKALENKRQAVMYQIMIPNALIKQLVYIGTNSGLTFDHPYFSPCLPTILSGMKKAGVKPEDASIDTMDRSYLCSNAFTADVLEAAKKAVFWQELQCIKSPLEARILLNPTFMSNPSSGIHIHTYKNISPPIDNLISSTSHDISTQISGVKDIATMEKRAALLKHLTQLSEHYYQIYEKINSGKYPADMKTSELETCVSKAETLAAYIQEKSEEASGKIKPRYLKTLTVKCQGKPTNFTSELPYQMTGEEFQTFIHTDFNISPYLKKALSNASSPNADSSDHIHPKWSTKNKTNAPQTPPPKKIPKFGKPLSSPPSNSSSSKK